MLEQVYERLPFLCGLSSHSLSARLLQSKKAPASSFTHQHSPRTFLENLLRNVFPYNFPDRLPSSTFLIKNLSASKPPLDAATNCRNSHRSICKQPQQRQQKNTQKKRNRRNQGRQVKWKNIEKVREEELRISRRKHEQKRSNGRSSSLRSHLYTVFILI